MLGRCLKSVVHAIQWIERKIERQSDHKIPFYGVPVCHGIHVLLPFFSIFFGRRRLWANVREIFP